MTSTFFITQPLFFLMMCIAYAGTVVSDLYSICSFSLWMSLLGSKNLHTFLFFLLRLCCGAFKTAMLRNQVFLNIRTSLHNLKIACQGQNITYHPQRRTSNRVVRDLRVLTASHWPPWNMSLAGSVSGYIANKSITMLRSDVQSFLLLPENS